MTELLPYKNYNTTLEKLKETLEEFGVAVVPNVLGKEDIDSMRRGMWTMLRRLTMKLDIPMVEDDPTTWGTMKQLQPMHGMLMQGHGVGHSQVAWDVRQHPRVAETFAALWDCAPRDLLTSFDGLSIHLPPEMQLLDEAENFASFHQGDWFHVDQSYSRPAFECVQGQVPAYDVLPGDGTLSIMEGSHKYGAEMVARFPEMNKAGDWYRLTPQQMDYLGELGCKRFNVECTAGSLVLWDSRTVHCGCLPQQGRPEPSPRFVVYVCQLPRDRLEPAAAERKMSHFKNLDMTSHWPDGRRVFARGRAVLPALPQPVLTKLGRTLAGFP